MSKKGNFQWLNSYLAVFNSNRFFSCFLNKFILSTTVKLTINSFHVCTERQKKYLWPNLKNLSGGLNLSRGLNMVGST